MEFETSKKFDKLVYKIKDKEALKKLKNLISKISIAKTINEIPNLTPMVGYPGYYRIKAGDYRLGIELDGETIWLLYFGKRDEHTYKDFP